TSQRTVETVEQFFIAGRNVNGCNSGLLLTGPSGWGKLHRVATRYRGPTDCLLSPQAHLRLKSRICGIGDLTFLGCAGRHQSTIDDEDNEVVYFRHKQSGYTAVDWQGQAADQGEIKRQHSLGWVFSRGVA